MGFATHLGPWLLGTVKNTTGTTSGTVRNMGATTVAQTIPLTFQTFTNSLTGTIGSIPAGSLITGVQIITIRITTNLHERCIFNHSIRFTCTTCDTD
jgi:hypothetical protein